MLRTWAPAAIDIAVLSIGIAWLWLRPSLAAALFLGLVQLASLAYNVASLIPAPFGSASHKALTVHCIWRLLSIACLIVGYLKLRRERAAITVQPSIPEPNGTGSERR